MEGGPLCPPFRSGDGNAHHSSLSSRLPESGLIPLETQRFQFAEMKRRAREHFL